MWDERVTIACNSPHHTPISSPIALQQLLPEQVPERER